MFRQCPSPRKCRKDGCNSSHNTVHGAERIYPSKAPPTNNSSSNAGANQSKLPSVQPSSKTTTLASVRNVKGLLQVTELQLKSSSGKDATALVLCDTAWSNSWVSNDLANRLGLHGTALRLTVKGINTEEVVDTKLVELIVTLRDNQAFEPFKVSPYVKEDLNVGAGVINIKALQETYPHLAILDPITYCYGNIEMIHRIGCVSCHPPVRVLRCRREVLALCCPLTHRLGCKRPSTVVFRFGLDLF